MRTLQSDSNIAAQKVDGARADFKRLDRELAAALQARDEAEVLKPVLEQSASLRIEYDELIVQVFGGWGTRTTRVGQSQPTKRARGGDLPHAPLGASQGLGGT